MAIGHKPNQLVQTLNQLGAQTTGIDTSKTEEKEESSNIMFGNPKDLIANSSTEFDIIYSYDTLCQAVVDQNTAEAIISYSFQKTTPQGLGIHNVSMVKRTAAQIVWANYHFSNQIYGYTNLEEACLWYENLSEQERIQLQYANQPHLNVAHAAICEFQYAALTKTHTLHSLILKK